MSLADSPGKPARKAKKSKSRDAAPVDASDPKESERHDGKPVASSSSVPSEGKKKKKSKSKATADEELSAHTPSDQTNRNDVLVATSRDASSEDGQKRKKKRRHAEEGSDEAIAIGAVVGEEAGADGAADATAERPKDKKSKHKDDNGSEVKKKSRKKKETDEVEVDADASTSEVTKKRKEKKRKRDVQVDGGAAAVETGDAPPDAPKKKKRKRGKTDLPNPAEDESLSEQASRALQYAFNQFDDPGSWKFHKARQNWLVRNLWSQQAIPDAHMPLLTRYLAGIQGGAREALAKTCRDVLAEDTNKPAAETEGAEATADEAEQPSTAVVDELKRVRATAVLAVLSD
ncbi:uncharacterized protein C8Q71DRAFT_730839 [Rhodofomes roseus]|uniref:WKF domain-containing protein n=1 Tax=Rhodofomes roseus TaxID=34475 RepID=A0ABQ8KY62_9APHY|nr:uncharacterized protein C8Q71DRAFT_730839 [Rhodofomes roseus]KAH9843988.1 hypothetical protein C8Q71DRAFT_730839 [Rhodofomes roseus]